MSNLNWPAFGQSMIWWILGAIIAYLVLNKVLSIFTRRIPGEIDDLILLSIRWPVATFILTIGISQSSHQVGFTDEILSYVTRGLHLVWIWLIVAAILIFFRKAHNAFKEIAQKTESELDDVLLPLLNVVGPVVTLIVAVLASVAWGFGIDLGLFVGILGGLSFIIAFAFQDILGNLFAGVYLLVGNPFKFGDFIQLGDGKIYKVIDIGLRATELYDIDKHIVSFLPNSALAAGIVSNITKPNVEIKASINVGVAYGTKKMDQVVDILQYAAQSHPYTLGSIADKLAAFEIISGNRYSEIKDLLRFFMERYKQYSTELAHVESEMNNAVEKYLKKEWSKPLGSGVLDDRRNLITIVRWITEHLMRNEVERLSRSLYLLIPWIDEDEEGGWNKGELADLLGYQKILRTELERVQQMLTLWMQFVKDEALNYELDTKQPTNEQDTLLEIEGIINQVADGSIPLIASMNSGFGEIFSSIESLRHSIISGRKQISADLNDTFLKEFPHATQIEDYETLYLRNRMIILRIKQQLDLWAKPKEWQTVGHEFQLDDEARTLKSTLVDQLPMSIPKWKRPDVTFTDFGASSLDFRLEFFIDDIVGEHFGREDDTVTDIRQTIVEQFAKYEIEIPFPQQDVWFRNRLEGNINNNEAKK